jgi:hypothetical protein
MRFECYDFAFSTGEKHIRLNRFIFYVEIFKFILFFVTTKISFNSTKLYLDFLSQNTLCVITVVLDLKFVIKHFSILSLIASFRENLVVSICYPHFSWHPYFKTSVIFHTFYGIHQIHSFFFRLNDFGVNSAEEAIKCSGKISFRSQYQF